LKILEQCPSLLQKENCKRETPLHMAVRAGKFGVVQELINHVKEVENGGQAAQRLLRATNLDEDTALHMAVRKGHLEMVRLLTSEDPDFSHPPNKADETPLFLAAERGAHEMVAAILEYCTSPAYSGPDGRTALHAATLTRNPEIANVLLQRNEELISKPDTYGWTPLHHAALDGNVEGVKMILEIDYLLANITTGDNDGNKTALQIAVAVGEVQIVEEILSACPDCWEIVDSMGHNILHIAVVMEREKVIEYIFKMSWSTELIEQRDNEGNTPLHLLAASKFKHKMPLESNGYQFTFNNKNMSPAEIASSNASDEIRWILDDYNPERLTGRNIVNIDNNIAKWERAGKVGLEEWRKAQEDEHNEIVERRRKMAKYQIIVASLLATITFTAGFTIPGGYDPNTGSEQGMAILLRETAFKAFIITNTLAVLLSTSSVYLFLTAMMRPNQNDSPWIIAYVVLEYALMATMVAFITGTYSMLSHSRLAVASCAIGSYFLLFYANAFRRYVLNFALRKFRHTFNR
jgi:ankyrin repeat protein